MDIGATWYNKGKGKSVKESIRKAKATAATGITTTTTIKKEKLDKDIRSKDMGMAKKKDTATKEKGKDTATTNMEAKEQCEACYKRLLQMWAARTGDLQLRCWQP